MNRDNVFFATCGLLLGLLIGSFLIGPRLCRSKCPDANMTPTVTGQPAAATGSTGPSDVMANVLKRLDVLKAEVARNPRNVAAYVELGNLYMDAAKFDKAAPYYSQALQLRDDANVATDLGVCYREIGNSAKALELFRRAQKTDPSHWQAQFNEAVVLADLGKVSEAREVTARLKVKRPKDPELARLEQELAALPR